MGLDLRILPAYKVQLVCTSEEDVHTVMATVNSLSRAAILDSIKELAVQEVKTLEKAVKIEIEINKV